MNSETEKAPFTLGILAHVDAGKTTLTEALLYTAGYLRKMGRVDHRDTFLDTHALEKARGITVFSKQARLVWGEQKLILLDTPGHADFSPETERAVRVMDGAVLLISAADGVTGQVRKLWNLLRHYHVPTFLFVNKMDQPGTDRERLLREVQEKLSRAALEFPCDLQDPAAQENIAVCDDLLTEELLNGRRVQEQDIRELILQEKLFPVYFGSALKGEGIRELLQGVAGCGKEKKQGSAFGARIYKVTRDPSGNRLVFLKITGGTLRVKAVLGEEKADQIRLYSGDRYESVQEAEEGELCAVTGISAFRAGDSLGAEKKPENTAEPPLLQPLMSSRIFFREQTDPVTALQKLRILEEEEPMLRLSADPSGSGEIQIRLMGKMQQEILQQLARERCGLEIGFEEPRVLYAESIRSAAEGVGHYEPLRHYAEVHLLLEPTGPGSGLTFENRCPAGSLAVSWQNQIMQILEKEEWIGVLTGAPLTNMKISLLDGKAHLRHTEGGDFRQAVCRAVRQGLMTAENILLEPVLEFRSSFPKDCLGRVLYEMQQRNAVMTPVEITGENAVLQGSFSASLLGELPAQFPSLTGGAGECTFSFRRYEPCERMQEIVEGTGYVPDLDREHPSSSVFCMHGAGVIIPWNEVRRYMHLDTGWHPENTKEQEPSADECRSGCGASVNRQRSGDKPEQDFRERQRVFEAGEKELMEIFERTYGPIRDRRLQRESEDVFPGREATAEASADPGGDPDKIRRHRQSVPAEEQYLLVDGYNIIFAWEELRDLAAGNIQSARDKLKDILSNYAGYTGEKVILVFDAYKVPGGTGSVSRYHNIDVIFTKEAETADLYIEKASHSLAKKHRVTVATSDAVEQVIIFGSGALRLSAAGLLEEIRYREQEMRERYLKE